MDHSEEIIDADPITEEMYQESGEAELLEKFDLDLAHRPHMNPIDGQTLEQLMKN